MSFDDIEKRARAVLDANKRCFAATNAYERYDANAALPPLLEDLGDSAEEILELTARVRAFESPWQPMDTAPLDGTWVLVWDTHLERCIVAHLVPGEDAWHETYGHAVHPRAWMPLPEPPR